MPIRLNPAMVAGSIMGGVLLREAVEADYPPFEQQLLLDDPGLQQQLVNRVRSDCGKLVVAEVKMPERGAVLVGFMALAVFPDAIKQGPLMTILWLTIPPEFRRRGIGRLLVRFAQSIAPQNGCPIIHCQKVGGYKLFSKEGFLARSGRLSVFRPGEVREWRCPVAVQRPSPLAPTIPLCIVRKEVVLRFPRPEEMKAVKAFAHFNTRSSIDMSEQEEIAKSAFIVIAHQPGSQAIIGVVAVTNGGWVNYVGCSVDWRLQGLGSFLLALGMDYLQETGVKKASLFPSSGRGRFYQRRGFYTPKHTKGEKRPPGIYITRVLDPDEMMIWGGTHYADHMLITPDVEYIIIN